MRSFWVVVWVCGALACSDEGALSSGAGSVAADAGGAGAASAMPAADAGKPMGFDYVNDVQPILMRYCTGCHRPGGQGPFELDTYATARAAASQAAGAVTSGFMPPCDNPPPGGCSRPTADETAILVEWAASSRPERL